MDKRHKKIEELSDQIIDNGLNILGTMFSNINTNTNTNTNTNIEYYTNETDSELKYIVFLPGVEKTNLNLKITGNKLYITGNTNFKDTFFNFIEEKTYKKEIVTSLILNNSNIDAKINNGILKIIIKKTSESIIVQ